MKKTSKKILSFFLAVVMAVSACSVGFTAWAQEVNPTDKLFNDTDLDAKTSIDEINKVLDTYLPDILTAVNGENNTLGNMGINIDEIKEFDSNGKYDSDAFYAFAGQLSLSLFKTLFSAETAGVKELFTQSNISELYHKNLIDANAPIDFYTYLAFVLEVVDNGYLNENEEVLTFVSSMAENLVALLNETVEDDAAVARQSNEQKISTLVSIIKSAQEYKTIDNALKFNKSFGSVETLNKTTVTISGKAYSLSKANATSEAPYILDAPALSSIKESDVKDYVSRYNQFAKDLGIQNFNCAEDVAGAMYINFITSTPYYADVIGAAAINKFSADGGNKLELDGKELLPSNYMTVLGNIYTPDMFKNDCKDKGYTVPEDEVQSTYEFVLGKIYVSIVTGVGEGKSYSDVAFGTYSNNVTDASGLKEKAYTDEFTKGLAVAFGLKTADEVDALIAANPDNPKAVYSSVFETYKETSSIFETIYTYFNFTYWDKANIPPKEQYEYDNFKMPYEVSIAVANDKINWYLDEYLMKNKVLINMVLGMLGVKDLSVDILYNTLYNVINNIAMYPAATILAVVPVLVTVVDQVLFQVLFLNESANDTVFGLLGNIEINGKPFKEYYQDAGDMEIGIGQTFFDLNYVLPALLNWFCGDDSYISGYYEAPYETNVPRIINIYAVDKALAGLKGFDKLFAGITDPATKEILQTLVTYATQNVTKLYSDKNGNKPTTELRKGANKVLSAIPEIINSLGTTFNDKYEVQNEWKYGKYFPLSDTYGTPSTKKLHTFVNELVEIATKADKFENKDSIYKTATKSLEEVNNLLINGVLNSLLDFVDGVVATENKVTAQIPVISGLLEALGGFGETSVITDVINNVFQITRNNDYSFTFAERENGLTGLSVENGYFLLSNIDAIVKIVMKVVENSQNTAASDAKATAQNSAPYAANAKNATKSNYSSLLTDENVANAKSILGKLDEMLADTLANSSINDYDMDSTEDILSGVINLLSNYFGAENADKYVQMADSYLAMVDNNYKPDSEGNIDYKTIYSNKNLTNFVVQTYAFIENILDVATSEIKVTQINEKYNVATEALKGIISPDAVGIRLSDKADVQKEIMALDNWDDVLVEGDNGKNSQIKDGFSLDWGIKAGDKESFYSAFASAFRLITSVISVLLIDANYYESVLQPVSAAVLSDMDVEVELFGEKIKPAQAVLDSSKVNTEDDCFMAIVRPVSAGLSAFYKQPATTLVDILKGFAKVVDDETQPQLSTVLVNAITPVKNEISGLKKIVNVLSPTLAGQFTEIEGTLDTVLGAVKIVKADLLIPLLNGVIDGLLGQYGIKLTLPAINWHSLASSKDEEVIILVTAYVIDLLLSNADTLDKLAGLLAVINPELSATLKQVVEILKKLDIETVFDILNVVLSLTSDPVEAYWTFLQYIQEKYTNFKYPVGVTIASAKNAVKQLDGIVKNVFPLLQGFGVVNSASLSGLLNDMLFTNANLTKVATALYSAVEGAASTLAVAGIDVTTKGFANILKDSSYGKTYSTAASQIAKADSWKNVKSVDWGFKDGSSKAKTGFVNAFAAILRPFNDVAAILLADGNFNIGKLIGDISFDNGNVSMKDGVLTIIVAGQPEGGKDSVIKIDLSAALEEIKAISIYGGNGYESAVIPLLEAFKCSGIKDYNTYLNEYKQAKDNLIINILNPLFNFVDKLANAPFDVLTSVLPNIAYFIGNGGLSQFVNNLLSPVTNIIANLKNAGIDVNEIIKQIAGKDLSTLISDALGIKVQIDLTNLNAFRVQDLIIPLVNQLLASNGINIQLSDIDWLKFAGLGTVYNFNSVAKHYGTATAVKVNDQGKVLITVLRYLLSNVMEKNNMKTIKHLVAGIEMDKTVKNILASVLNTIGQSTPDQIIAALIRLLNGTPTNSFWNYTGYKFKNYSFSYPEGMDLEFLQNLAPSLDGLVVGFINLNETIGGLIYKNDIINTLVQAIYTNIEKVKISGSMNLTQLLKQTGIDLTPANFAKLLTDKDYGKSFGSVASQIKGAKSWSKVNFKSLNWGVSNRETFVNALCAALRPIYGVLDVLLNDASLGLFGVLSIPGSDGYTSSIVPFMEALSLYNIKTQYQYREDILKSYDNILLDILNPLLDKVEDILYAPIETLMDMLPNLAYFFANGGLLQLVDNLTTPVTALLDTLKPIVNVNDILKQLNVKLGGKYIDVYHISDILKPYVEPTKVVPMINNLLATTKIEGKPIGIKLNNIDWFQLASHGELVSEASQAATIGIRTYVKADQAETLIAVLRYLINTIQTGDNLDKIKELVTGLVGNNDTVSGILSQVFDMFAQYKGDELIAQINELIAMVAG